MKKILITSINFYQNFLYLFLRNAFGINPTCRFELTCSRYAKESIFKYGALTGTKMSIIRILKCQPFYTQEIKKRSINANI